MASREHDAHPITPTHRKKFAAYLRKWQARLGMQNWRIHLSRYHTRAAADTETFFEDKMASIRLGRDWGSMEPTDHMLSSVALHELMHVRFEAFHAAYRIKDPDKRWSAIMAAEHDIINTCVWLTHPDMEGLQ